MSSNMSSPYDAVLRIRRREMDDFGIAIAGAQDHLGRINQAFASRGEAMQREGEIVIADPLLSSHAYMARLRGERAELAEAGRQADAALDGLRVQAAEAFASLRATEESAEQHARAVELDASRKEQGEFDDIAAARLSRIRR